MDMSIERTNSVDGDGERRNAPVCQRSRSLNFGWRPSSLIGLVTNPRRARVLNTCSATESSDNGNVSSVLSNEKNFPHRISTLLRESSKRGWNTLVSIVIVEADGLPNPPTDGSVHSVYCKIRLGTEAVKSKSVQSVSHPEWRERHTFHLNKDPLLRVSLWDKGKLKNFMGSCVIDLSKLEKERTHEIWQPLDDGFGSIHLSLTMCAIRDAPIAQVTSNTIQTMDNFKEKRTIDLNFNDWQTVGQLQVKVIGAKGLSGKPTAYCTLELGNSRVQTLEVKASSEPMWNKNYVFNVQDITSTLDVKVYDNSVISSMSSLRLEYLGKVSIPLLRIRNGDMRWYALKDRSKRHSAKGNCPRILLEMTLIWNPVKASLKLFRPSEEKYIKKPPKFDVALVYNNLLFIRDLFNFLYELNEAIKRFLEWDNPELCLLVLIAWLLFWYHITLAAAPLLLLVPFAYHWFNRRNTQYERSFMRTYTNAEGDSQQSDGDKADTSLISKVQGLPELTISITNGVEYLASVAERIYNLVTFKVPFLSYLTMLLLIAASAGLYLFSFNFLMMGFGLYKYTRKYLEPHRKLNNDVLDFLARVPDNEKLKDWEELAVPEPHHYRKYGMLLSRTSSSTI